MKQLHLAILIVLPLVLAGCQQRTGFGFRITDEPAPVELTVPPPAVDEDDGNDAPEPITGMGGLGMFGGEMPDTPSNLRVEDVGLSSISLKWNDVLYESGFKLYRKKEAEEWGHLLTIPNPNVTQYTDTELPQGSAYCYKVSAFNISGESELSAEACGTTATCSNTSGPAIVRRPAYPSQQFPSVNRVSEGEFFSLTSTVAIRYRLTAGDACNNIFDVAVSVYRNGELLQTFQRSAALPDVNYEHTYEIPREDYLPQGQYAVGITATDGTYQDEVLWENYFEVLLLPADPGQPPELSSLTSTKATVCPNEYYVVRRIFDDDSITAMKSILSSSNHWVADRWVKNRMFEDGSARDTVYARNRGISLRHTTNPSAPVAKVYTAQAFDFELKSVSPPDSVTVTIRPDEETPEFSSTTFPGPAATLNVGEAYTVSAEATDDCPVENLQFRFEFQPTAGAATVLRTWSTTKSATFVPNGISPAVGDQGRFVIKVRDVALQVREEVSPVLYTIAPSEAPQLNLTVDPSTGHGVLTEVTLILDVFDTNLPGVELDYLGYSHEGADFNEIAAGTADFSDGVHEVAWTIPVMPGDYTIKARVRDEDLNVDEKTISIAVTGVDSSYQFIVLDLNLDGSMPFTETVQFVIDHTGVPKWTKWLNGDDGYLIMDRNQDGVVNDVFDFAFLQELKDEAGDVIDSSDQVFEILRIWRDADSDGGTDTGELMTLDELNILTITLEPCCSYTALP